VRVSHHSGTYFSALDEFKKALKMGHWGCRQVTLVNTLTDNARTSVTAAGRWKRYPKYRV